MAKSADNFLNLENAFIKNSVNPLAYRYSALSIHYRKPMEYRADAIAPAATALNNLYDEFLVLQKSFFQGKPDAKLLSKFTANVNDDLNMPQALAVAWEVIKSNLSGKTKRATLLEFDKVLGFGLNDLKRKKTAVPPAIIKLAEERQKARQAKDWQKADEIRKKVKREGYIIEDKNNNQFEIKTN